jgi:MYXO-CTERM domain-containing protein
MKRFALVALCVVALVPQAAAQTISSAEVITRARAFAEHPWYCTTANLTASCAADYESVYVPGPKLGLPYDWGGYMSLHTFDTGIHSGLGAGSYSSDGILSCTVGHDCSGFVSMCWGVGHYTTRSIPNITRAITHDALKRGDVLNDPGYHVVLFSHRQPDGRPFLYEAAGYNVRATFDMGWAYLDGFEPRRYLRDDDDAGVIAVGTGDNPFVIETFPYVDRRDTRDSMSDLYDYCAQAPSTRETGREYVYRVVLRTPGRLSASVQDGPGVDIDVHFYDALNEYACLARDDSTLERRLDCGTYYIVADTWSNGTTEYPGVYDLVVDFVPEASPCGEVGQPGSACSFPGDPSLPVCDENLGATTCLYTGDAPTDDSFCSMGCRRDEDCTGALPGGCCVALSSGESYCLVAGYCPDAPDDAEPAPSDDQGAPDPAADAGSGDDGDAGLGDAADDRGPSEDPSPGDDTAPGQDLAPSGAEADSLEPPDAPPTRDSGAGPGPTGGQTADTAGCGCGVASRPGSSAPLVLALALGLGLARRRRLAPARRP